MLRSLVGSEMCIRDSSYLLKAPLVPTGTPVVNALFKQRAAIENILRACLSLPPQNHMSLEHRLMDMQLIYDEMKPQAHITADKKEELNEKSSPPMRSKLVTGRNTNINEIQTVN